MTYDVHFASGLKIEFGSNGEWKEISRTSSPVESRFVPKQIVSTVSSRWPGAEFKKIERSGTDMRWNSRIAWN